MANPPNTLEGSPLGTVDTIFQAAFTSRASDIHLDPGRTSLHIRFRVDGVLYPFKDYPNAQKDVILSRIKVMAQLDVSDERLPQDGHIEYEYREKLYNLRVSTVHTTHGTAIVLRIFNRENILSNLDALGFTAEQLKEVKKIIAIPHGLNLMTGPTGSGKTTLLYALLDALNTRSRSIVTLEDPVELEMKWMRQTQIHESIGLTFAKAVRAALRQNPDVIMLGEIRDPDTAEMAYRAASSGVRVFSTFHTFDLSGVIIRLLEMGVSRSIVAYGTNSVISSRLVRKICENCKIESPLTDLERSVLGDSASGKTFYKGKGCDKCLKSGYFGMIGLYEIVSFNDEMRLHIIEDVSSTALIKYLGTASKKSLYDSAREAIMNGITTIQEISAVLGEPSEKRKLFS